jgi:hypothetical protein
MRGYPPSRQSPLPSGNSEEAIEFQESLSITTLCLVRCRGLARAFLQYATNALDVWMLSTGRI